LRDRDRIEQFRLRERIGNFYKYVDNALINNPDPKSAHFSTGNQLTYTYSLDFLDEDRYNRDYAAFDKQMRQ
jgi:hypothetical protein